MEDLKLQTNPNARRLHGGATVEESYVCDICGMAFSCRTYLNKHFKNVHVETNSEHQQCPKCPMKFKRYDTFWEHIVRVHENPAVVSGRGSVEEQATQNATNGLGGGGSSVSALEEEKVLVLENEEEIEALVESLICNEEGIRKCKKCGKEFPGRSNVKRHIREVHLKLQHKNKNSRRKTCDICNKSFVNNSVYKAHMRNIHIQPYPTIQCQKCFRKYKEMKTLRKHMKDAHNVDLVRQPAPKASKPVDNDVSEVEGHSDEDDTGEVDPVFTCNKCEISFVSINGLNRHNKAIHHINSDSGSTAETQFAELPTSKKVVLRLQQPCEGDKEEYECADCGKKFPSKSAMWGHSVIHQKAILEPHTKSLMKAMFGAVINSTLACKICGTEVTGSVEGRLHVYIKHPEKFKELVTNAAVSTRGLLSCNYCSEKLPCSEAMIDHIETSHPDTYIPICTICGHKELKERDINIHYKQYHPNVVRYSCDVCNAPFNQKRDLVHHVAREHSANSVQCPYCPEKHVKVKLHVTVKHPEKADEFTQMKKAAIREEQIARMRFNQFLDKGNKNSRNKRFKTDARKIPRRQQNDKSLEDKNDSVEECNREEGQSDYPEYESNDDEESDRKPNVCFVQETQRITIPELYQIEKPTDTPHLIEVRRLPPPTPDEGVVMEECHEKDSQECLDSPDNAMDVDMKPDLDKLQTADIQQGLQQENQREERGSSMNVERTLVLCIKRPTNTELAKWPPYPSTHDDGSNLNSTSLESSESLKTTGAITKRTRKRQSGRGYKKQA